MPLVKEELSLPPARVCTTQPIDYPTSRDAVCYSKNGLFCIPSRARVRSHERRTPGNAVRAAECGGQSNVGLPLAAASMQMPALSFLKLVQMAPSARGRAASTISKHFGVATPSPTPRSALKDRRGKKSSESCGKGSRTSVGKKTRRRSGSQEGEAGSKDKKGFFLAGEKRS